MKIANKILLFFTLSFQTLSAYCAYPTTNNAAAEIKNTQQEITADSQKNATNAEVELTRKLRAKIMADNQLSTEAHNIKIITMPKAITLKGPVTSRAEKVKIENYARSMAGDKRVYNQLTY